MNLIIPTIGSKGFYTLKAPFDTLMLENEQYTCQAIRKIGDYLANSEDAFTIIYEPYGLTQTEYEADLASDMPIVSLQAETGQWLYIPAAYILTYPITNGIAYHGLMLGINLGPMVVDEDLSSLKTNISNLIYDTLGITPEIKEVQISKVTLVPREYHDQVVSARKARSSQILADSARLKISQERLSKAEQKIAALEEFIKSKHLEEIAP